jgi:hypothetical protein
MFSKVIVTLRLSGLFGLFGLSTAASSKVQAPRFLPEEDLFLPCCLLLVP